MSHSSISCSCLQLFCCSGSRAAEQCWDAFYVDLTLQSVAAVQEAQTKVASTWHCAFEIDGTSKHRRQTRKRTFKQLAEVLRRSEKAKKLGAETKSGKIKKIKKKKVSTKKIHTLGHKEIEHKEVNYSRSKNGSLLIQQQLQKLMDLDKTANPARPMFDVDTGLCRLKCLD